MDTRRHRRHRSRLALALAGAFAGFAGLTPSLQAAQFAVGTFAPWPGYAIPNGQWMSADVNGDGKADIIHAVAGADYVNTWLSNGNGSYTVKSFRPWSGYGIPNGVWLTGDINGDGKADIVHAVANTDYVHTWMSNGDGTYTMGTFRPWAGYGIPNGEWRIADVNGDGKADLIHAVAGADYVNTWLSNGNGTFTVKSFRPWAGYGIPNGVWLTADLNGDGKADIVHAVANTDYVHTWMSRGDGTYTMGTFRPWAGYGIPNGQWMTGDVNGDGKTDLIHAVAGADYVNTWLSNGSGGFTVRSFRPWAGYGIPNGEWRVADLDGDGKADIFHAVANTSYAHQWLSNGDGTYRVQTFSPWAGYAIPNGVWLTGDFNGDRKTDIIHAVANTNYVHTWRSTLPRPGELSLDGLEITQSVQNMAQEVGLVADKRTIARAYVSINGGAAVTVRGVLTATRTGAAPVSITSLNTVTLDPALAGNLRAKRENLASSLNFEVPPTLRSAGATQFRITVQRVSPGAALVCADCDSSPVGVSFATAAPLRVRVLGLRYSSGTPATVKSPRALDYTLVRSWLGRAYPVSTLTMSTASVNASAAWPFSCNDANAQLATLRANDVAAGTDKRTHYFGLVADGGGFMRGCAASIPGSADPTAVASGPTGTPSGSFGWDTDGSYGDWYTGHELGHTYGRLHPGSGCGDSADDSHEPFTNGAISGPDGAWTGLDVGDTANGIPMAALPGAQWFDVMTYCRNQWISFYTYNGIRARLTGENALPAGAPAPKALKTSAALPPMAQVGERPEPITGAKAAPVLAAPRRAAPMLAAAPVTGHARPPAIIDGTASPATSTAPASEPPAAAYATPPTPVIGYREVAAAPVANARAVGDDIPMQRGDLLSVVATVNLTRQTGRLVSMSRIPTGLATPVGPEDARIEFLDARGKVLAAYAVPFRRDSDVEAGADQTGLIDAVVPFSTTAAKVRVSAFGTQLGERDIPAKPPRLGKISVLKSKALDEGATLSWTAVAGPLVSYSVQSSEDGGKSWQTLAIGLREPRFQLPPAEGGVTPRYRVIAHDGIHNTIVPVR